MAQRGREIARDAGAGAVIILSDEGDPARVLVDAQSGPDLAQLIVESIAARESVAPTVDGRLRAVSR